MKRIFSMVVIGLAFALTATQAQAGGKTNPFGYGPACGGGNVGTFQKMPVPTFMAAPWYLYWPYNAHFQTPSPMYNAPYYGPPSSGYGGMVNPYFANPYQQAPVYAPAPAPAMPMPMPKK